MGIALCLLMVWATRERRAKRPAGGFRGTRGARAYGKPLDKVRGILMAIGLWMVEISKPTAEPGCARRRNLRPNPTNAATPRRYERTMRPPSPRQAATVDGIPSTPHPHVERSPTGTGTTVEVYLDDLMIWDARTSQWRVVPNQTPEQGNIPGTSLEEETTPPYDSEMSPSARGYLDRARREIAREAGL